MTTFTSLLLQRGDEISIENGRTIIRPSIENATPVEYQVKHIKQCTQEILTALNIDAYEYVSFTTGFYGPKKLQGATLQFRSITTNLAPYVIFNVELTRKRNVATGKAGIALSDKKFYVGRRHLFYNFWIASGLAEPKSLTLFYERMGKLKSILFTATIENNRMDAKSLCTLSISSTQIRNAFLTDNLLTISRQSSDNFRIKTADKDFVQSPGRQGQQSNQTTYEESHDNTVISKCGYKTNVVTFFNNKKSQDEETSKFLDDFIENPKNRRQ